MKKIIFIIMLMIGSSASVSGQCPVTVSAGGPTTFCKGGNVLLTATNGIGYTWQWRKNGNNINGAVSQTYTVTTSGSYTVLVSATGGCTAVSNAVAVTVTLDNASITTHNGGTGIACVNGGENFHATTGPGFTYQWKLNGNNINGAMASTYPTTVTGIYSCNITSGICSAISNSITAYQQTASVTTFDPTIFCTGSASLYVTVNVGTGGGGATYQWKLNGIDIAGANSGNYSASGTGQYSCVVSDLSFCNASTPSNNMSIQAGVPPQISVAAVTGGLPVIDLCNGQMVDLYVVDNSNGQVWPGGVVDWHKDGQPVSPFPGGNYLLGVHESGIYNAYITTSCGISYAQNGMPVRSIDPNYDPPYINNYGVTSSCNSIFLTVEPSSISFGPSQWKKNGVDIPGAIGPTYYATETGNYSCTVSNSCTTMVISPVPVTITGPVANITPQGPLSICSGASVLLDATWPGGLYQWYLNSTPIAGAVNATYSATSAGSYYVRVTTAGCGSVNSGAVTVTVNASPAPAVSAGGSLTFCSGGSVVLSTNNTAGASYQWKKNNVVIGGATLNTYTANSTGTYKVVKTNAAGCTGTSSGKQVTVNSLPTATATAQGPVSFCAGDSVLIKANYNATFSYQWKKNNSNISGATLKNYTAKTAGDYKVKVTNVNGCTKISNIVTVSVPCREGENESHVSGFNATVYPNPSSGDFIFGIQSEDDSKTVIDIYDLMGKLIRKEISYGHEVAINGSGLNPGIYTAVITNDENNKVLKIVKTK